MPPSPTGSIKQCRPSGNNRSSLYRSPSGNGSRSPLIVATMLLKLPRRAPQMMKTRC
jgi:hypothetical protein